MISVINSGPVVTTPIEDQNATVGELFTFTISENTFIEPEGEEFTIDVSGMPTWLSWEPSSRTFSGTPPLGSQGTSIITILAVDVNLNQNAVPFTLTGENFLSRNSLLSQD
jgi:hypothetical protein